MMLHRPWFYRNVMGVGIGVYARMEFKWFHRKYFWRLSIGPLTISRVK